MDYVPADAFTVQERIEKLRENFPQFFTHENRRREQEAAKQAADQAEQVEPKPVMEWDSTLRREVFKWDPLCKAVASEVLQNRRRRGFQNEICMGYEELLQEARVKAIELAHAGKDVFRVSLRRHLWRYITENSPQLRISDQEIEDVGDR